MSETLLTRAAERFGDHPMGWPVPPSTIPRWWQCRKSRRWRIVCDLFGNLSQDDLDAFWAEVGKGQSVYEDAGGYMLRCYRAMLALPVDDPYTYAQAVADLSPQRGSDD